MKRGKTPYKMRARLIGAVDWICPQCGHLNKTRVMMGQWKVKCNHKQCGRKYGLGLRFVDIAALNRAGVTVPVPDDYVFPSVPAPVPIGADRQLHQVVA